MLTSVLPSIPNSHVPEKLAQACTQQVLNTCTALAKAGRLLAL
jgi:hypothetical protein